MRGARLVAAALLSALLFFLILALPNHPGDFAPDRLWRMPLELPALLALLWAIPPPAKLLRLVVTAMLTVVLLLKLADIALFQALSRPFNLVFDSIVFSDGFNLLSGAVGALPALILTALTLLIIPLLAVLIFRATGVWVRLRSRRAISVPIALLMGGAVLLHAADGLGRWAAPVQIPGVSKSTQLLVRHAQRARTAQVELVAFRQAAETDPFAIQTGLFDLLDGRDVIVLFIESYGRTSLENPLYGPTHRQTLQAASKRLRSRGLAMRSAWLTSPIAGGQSWLAHGTFMSGLKIGDQARYGAMLAAQRQALPHLASASGYQSAAVMPAITMPWPEGPRLGFEKILAAKDLNYQGAPFNWVTMPDQFTLATFRPLLGEDPRPLFLQIALISSHAPWVPIPPMIPWEQVGDGQVFDQWANSGDPPRIVWRDRDRVRAQYRKAIDYSLNVTLSFVERQSQTAAPLIIVLGDHQPGSWIAQMDNRDVPIHLIGPPELLAKIDHWGFSEGLIPGQTAPVWPMQAFRDRFIRAFSNGIAGS